MTIKRFDPVPTQYAKAVVRGDTVHLAGLIAEDWEQDIAQSRRVKIEPSDIHGLYPFVRRLRRV